MNIYAEIAKGLILGLALLIPTIIFCYVIKTEIVDEIKRENEEKKNGSRQDIQ